MIQNLWRHQTWSLAALQCNFGSNEAYLFCFLLMDVGRCVTFTSSCELWTLDWTHDNKNTEMTIIKQLGLLIVLWISLTCQVTSWDSNHAVCVFFLIFFVVKSYIQPWTSVSFQGVLLNHFFWGMLLVVWNLRSNSIVSLVFETSKRTGIFTVLPFGWDSLHEIDRETRDKWPFPPGSVEDRRLLRLSLRL